MGFFLDVQCLRQRLFKCLTNCAPSIFALPTELRNVHWDLRGPATALQFVCRPIVPKR